MEITPAFKLACYVCAKVYDPAALKQRNDAEGIGTRRLAAEYADDFAFLHAERMGWLRRDRPSGDSEYVRADDARVALANLRERIGGGEFNRVSLAWADTLDHGIDY